MISKRVIVFLVASFTCVLLAFITKSARDRPASASDLDQSASRSRRGNLTAKTFVQEASKDAASSPLSAEEIIETLLQTQECRKCLAAIKSGAKDGGRGSERCKICCNAFLTHGVEPDHAGLAAVCEVILQPVQEEPKKRRRKSSSGSRDADAGKEGKGVTVERSYDRGVHHVKLGGDFGALLKEAGRELEEEEAEKARKRSRTEGEDEASGDFDDDYVERARERVRVNHEAADRARGDKLQKGIDRLASND
eukprot:gnl/MRDRNA2_/MRDRNA2_29890_c0_seq1.p1 gnl/MRDRNA2_/MRDRNA2_29890_c0~~gnl/MRDRNA2_/MRDRNA2_29890_c0_seq1.p1  ORF type:complete len:252 (+),score=52.29 gnl/MRDRNA2_/MRDRNA2_29890_c0_seq1:106-861(+)